MTNKERIAYLAGIIDGEGCIGAWNAYGHKRAQSPIAQICVRVAMTTPFAVKMLHAAFGGSLKVAERPKGSKRQFVWQVVSRKAEACIIKLLPYLQEKHEQAEVALTLANLRRPRNKTGIRLTNAEITERQKHVQKLKDLKRVEYPSTAIQ